MPAEDVVGRALDVGESVPGQVLHGADHVVEPHEERPPRHGEHDRDEERPDEALDRLLGAQLDQLVPPKRHPAHVGSHIVDDDERGGHPEPDHALSGQEGPGQPS